MSHDQPRSSDLFIDRYMPGANVEEREEAAANLERFVAVLVRIDKRLEWERQGAIRQNTDVKVESNVSQ